ncbi:MAG TPA: hypothetical protein VFS52_20975 [Steroidobacteraceae bacterium]|nr:hypothetical protein [Steroidobacteraceae bacterium]
MRRSRGFRLRALLFITQVIPRHAQAIVVCAMRFVARSKETKFETDSLLDTALRRGADRVGNGVQQWQTP